MEQHTAIKICGIRTEREAEYLNEEKIDYAGFVLYEKSKRFVDAEQIEKIFKILNVDIRKVAVTVNPSTKLIQQIQKMGFDILQIHGEGAENMQNQCEIPIWQAVNIKEISKLEDFMGNWNQNIDILKYGNKIKTRYNNGILFDAEDYGSGKTFSWNQEARRWRSRFADQTFILAGGLRPDNVEAGIRYFQPDIVDVSSGVEDDAGKNKELIRKFVKTVRKTT